MTERETDPPSENQLLQEAAEWFARMRGPDAETSRRDFEAWLARGALHRRAYNRAAEIFAMGKLLSDDRGTPVVENPVPGRTRSPSLAVLTICLLVLAGTWAVTRTFYHPDQERGVTSGSKGDLVAELTTGDGEQRTIKLADGSIVRLEPQSRLSVRFTATARQVVLKSGLGRFQVAHEPRPFTVFAGGGSVTAHGTIFDVGLTIDHRVSVRLIEGVVDVKVPSQISSRHESRQLRAGESISYDAIPSGPLASTAPDEHDAPVARNPVKPQAQDYDGVRLADLIATANQSATRPIRLADPQLGDRRLSGRFGVDDTDLLAERVAALFDLAVDRSSPSEIVLKAH